MTGGLMQLISIGASCIYSSKKSKNFSETDIFYGPLHPSVEAYGFCKLSQIVGIKAYKSQYDLNYFSVIFPNIYGPGDDFSLENSHVIGALVKKFVDAKRLKKDIVNCWGSGKEIRDGIYVDDAVESLIRVVNTEMNKAKSPNSTGEYNRVKMGVASIGIDWAIIVPDIKVITLR